MDASLFPTIVPTLQQISLINTHEFYDRQSNLPLCIIIQVALSGFQDAFLTLDTVYFQCLRAQTLPSLLTLLSSSADALRGAIFFHAIRSQSVTNY